MDNFVDLVAKWGYIIYFDEICFHPLGALQPVVMFDDSDHSGTRSRSD